VGGADRASDAIRVDHTEAEHIRQVSPGGDHSRITIVTVSKCKDFVQVRTMRGHEFAIVNASSVEIEFHPFGLIESVSAL